MIATRVEGAGLLAEMVAAGLGEGTARNGPADGAPPDGFWNTGNLVLVAEGAVDAVINRVRHIDSGAVVIVIDGTMEPMTRHLLASAVEPLAIAGAPLVRISAVRVEAGAEPSDVVGAVAFLLSAKSTTGQILIIEPCTVRAR